MASSKSFVPMLARWCEIVKPKRILEWGPGYSTDLMARLFPDAEIISVEHQMKWFLKFVEELRNYKNVRLLLREEREDTPMETYVNPGVEGKFDLIFVDGRNRVECLKKAKKILAPGGVVILHDSERKQYKEGIDLFEKVEEFLWTICLR